MGCAKHQNTASACVVGGGGIEESRKWERCVAI